PPEGHPEQPLEHPKAAGHEPERHLEHLEQQPPAQHAEHPQPEEHPGQHLEPPQTEGHEAARPAEQGRAGEPGGKAPDKQDFAEILAEFEHGGSGERRANPAVGEKVSGKILSIGDQSIFVDLGTKSEGVIETAQLRDAEGNVTVNVGDTLEATVTAIEPEGGALVLKKRSSGGRGGHQEVALELRQAHQYGMPVEGQVTGINKGGAEVQVYGMRAFCPLSQLDMRYVENPQQFIGQRLRFRVTRIEEGTRGRRPDIVLSRRAILEEEAQAKAAELRSRLQVGAVVTGKVTSITTYGAFLDLGGLEGLLHVSEIGFSRLADPREVLAVGQEIEVQVIKIEKGKDEKRPERISLSRRALERDPWRDAAERFPETTVVDGKVVRTESFGAFIELAPGLEGLVHISELGTGRRVNHAREAVQVGQEVKVRVLGVDVGKRRISLSMATAGEEREEPRAREHPHRDRGGDHRERGERGGDRGDKGDRGRDRDTEPSANQPASSFGALGDFFKNSTKQRR
nr:S1 RNA-binding domain-containing protein [Acidobacteriota bacterium]